MTNKEAIQELRWVKEGSVLNQEARDALDMAITALEISDSISQHLDSKEFYCDCNICFQNDANGIGCEDCEVTKAQELENSNDDGNNSNNSVENLTACRVPEDKETIDDDTVCVVFCNWNVAKELVDKDENIEDCLVISSYLDDDEAIVVSKDEFLDWVRGEQDGWSNQPGRGDRTD